LEPGLIYAQALKEETMVLGDLMVNGELADVKRNLSVEFEEEDINPQKRLKATNSGELMYFLYVRLIHFMLD
jgi:hypothetical protein